MAWVKLDDSMPHHPKVVAAGPVAFALDVAAICYSNRYATDGFIARSVLRTCLPGVRNVQKIAQKLVECGRWVETDGGWLIHDIAEYQPTAEEQKNLSRVRAEAGRKGGQASGRSRANSNQGASKPEATPKQVASSKTNPDPTRPDPTVSDLLPTVVDHGAAANGRAPNPWYNAAAAALDLPLRGDHEGLLGSIAAKCRGEGHPPEEILRRAALHLATFNFPMTPGSLNKRWVELGSRVVTATPAERKKIQGQIDQMRQREKILAAMGETA